MIDVLVFRYLSSLVIIKVVNKKVSGNYKSVVAITFMSHNRIYCI